MTNSGSNTVTKLRASDGFDLGGFNTGSTPHGVAFGMLLGTFTVESAPEAIAFDGSGVWVSNSGSGTTSKR